MRTKAQIIEKIYELNNSIINEYKSFTYLKSNSKNLKYLSLRELEEVELSLLDKIQELSFEKENEKFKISEEGIKIINLVFEIKSLLKNKLYLNRKNFINKIKLLFDSSVEIELFFEAKDLDIYLKELPDKRITLSLDRLDKRNFKNINIKIDSSKFELDIANKLNFEYYKLVNYLFEGTKLNKIKFNLNQLNIFESDILNGYKILTDIEKNPFIYQDVYKQLISRFSNLLNE